MKKSLIIVLCSVVFAGCKTGGGLSPEAAKVQKYMVDNAVIAHRGTTRWAPELTEAAFRWARNTGADYMELDVHHSKDGVPIIMHDGTFNRTTDVAVKFPGREKDPVGSFTFEEIMQLDAGVRFNERNPDRAREGFVGQGVLVFEDVFRIAEGKRIKRDADGKRVFGRTPDGDYTFEYVPDEADNGNRPGIYIETKAPESYADLEQHIFDMLTALSWNVTDADADAPAYLDGKVNIGRTRGKILIQTFSRQGMKNFQQVFGGKVLCSFLVGGANDEAAADEIIAFAKSTGAQFIGSNLGEGAKDGMSPMFSQRLHAAGLKCNVYSFDTDEQMEQYYAGGKPLHDGMITNRTDLTLDFNHAKGLRPAGKQGGTPEEVLSALGY